MGRSQVLFNQRKGRGRGAGRGTGRSGAQVVASRRILHRPKWSAGKSSNGKEDDQEDVNAGLERLDHEVSLLEANVSSQRYVMPYKNDDPEAVTLTLNLLHSDPGKFKQQMNYALKHVSLEDLYRVPYRLISTTTGAEPDLEDESSTVISSLSSVTAKLRVTHVLEDPVASRLGIQNLPSNQLHLKRDPGRHSMKSGRSSLLGVTTRPDMDAANDESKISIVSSQESEEMDTPSKSFDMIESTVSTQASQQQEEESTGDLIMRLRSLPSLEEKEDPHPPAMKSNEEDMDEWLKETLNDDETFENKKAKDKEEDALDEENLEDWLDSII